jgi:2-methylcitrate dehydratase PrpD
VTNASDSTTMSPPTAALAEYLASAAATRLPTDVAEHARAHLLDTIAATVSGTELLAGRKGADVATALGGPPEALVYRTGKLVSAYAAALGNGFAAHADETDDSHAPTISHPGCAVVPAVMAVAERRQASGALALAAVAAGYDVGCRVGRALGTAAIDPARSKPSSHAIIGCFAAAAGAAVVERLSTEQMGYVLSYAAQSASGVSAWQRDPNHVQKAYVFAGMPASSGVLAATMVAQGLDGVSDIFDGEPNFLSALSAAPAAAELSGELGVRYEVTLTNIKKYAVASPAQAAVQAAENLVREHQVAAADIASVQITLPSHSARIVDGRDMPDVNVQYLVAGTLVDGRFSFAMAHGAARMAESAIDRLRQATTLVPDPSMNGRRCARVTVTMVGGATRTCDVPQVRGTVDDPMTAEEITEKAADLMGPVLGAQRAAKLIAAIRDLESVPDVTSLRSLLTPA